MIVLLFIQIIAVIYFGSIGRHDVSVSLANIFLMLVASTSMLIFGEIVLELIQSKYRVNSEQIWYVVTGFLSVGAATYLLGSNEGLRDKTLSTSKLPFVAVADSSDTFWRLLSTRDNKLYLVKPSNDPPLIKIINIENAELVVPYKKEAGK